MQLIFLDEQTLNVLDHAYATNDFEITLDALVPQKSTFEINKQSLKAQLGDYLVLRGEAIPYIGVITAIDEEKSGSIKVTTKDFLSIFDVTVPVASYSGSISTFLVNLLNKHFKSSGDAYQNLPYLLLEVEATKNGSLTYDADKTANILDLVEEFSKTYGLRLAYELVLSEGKFSNIKVKVVAVTKGIKFKSTLGTITDLVVSDTNEVSTNKIIFFPKAANTSYKTNQTYYLLNDGTISTSTSSDKRLPKVKFKYQSYSDKDYSSLLTKATSALVDSSLEHNITFNFSFATNKISSLESLTIGTYVVFVTPTKTYETLVTKITYKGTFAQAKITLGEYRASLTDKLKLLDRRNKNNGSN